MSDVTHIYSPGDAFTEKSCKYRAYTPEQTALLVSSLSMKASRERVEREAHSTEACTSL